MLDVGQRARRCVRFSTRDAGVGSALSREHDLALLRVRSTNWGETASLLRSLNEALDALFIDYLAADLRSCLRSLRSFQPFLNSIYS